MLVKGATDIMFISNEFHGCNLVPATCQCNTTLYSILLQYDYFCLGAYTTYILPQNIKPMYLQYYLHKGCAIYGNLQKKLLE